jgi:hypothetical protein
MVPALLVLVTAILAAFFAASGAVAQQTDPSRTSALAAPRQSDAPPDGVGEQYIFFGFGGGNVCTLSAVSGMDPCSTTVASALSIFLQDFVPGTPSVVQITRADGVTQRFTVSIDIGPSPLTWVSFPGDALGDYSVIASQGGLRASGRFRVTPATSPTVAFLPDEGFPGTKFRAGIAGFGPGQVITPALYLHYGSCGSYLGTLPPVMTDANGQAIYALQTGAGDTPSTYNLYFPGASLHEGGFFTISTPQDSTTATGGIDIKQIVYKTVNESNCDEVTATRADAIRSYLTHVDDPSNTLGADARKQQLNLLVQEVRELAGSRQYLKLRMTAPLLVRSAQRLLDGTIEAVAHEEWRMQRFGLDDNVKVDDRGVSVDWHYLLEADGGKWYVVRADAL